MNVLFAGSYNIDDIVELLWLNDSIHQLLSDNWFAVNYRYRILVSLDWYNKYLGKWTNK